jgi:hypothetical protein
MRLLWAGMLLLSFVAPAVADDQIALRVLYCGDPGSDREADFRKFLEQHFAKVTLHNYSTFTEADAKEHDVVILDWTYEYDGKGHVDPQKTRRWHPPHPSRDFSRPVILIGQAGGLVSDSLKLKVNWLCLCLNGPAHHLRLEHSLFHSPLEVAPQLEQIPTPETYSYLTLDKKLGPTMTVWKVQTKNPPEVDPGLVSDLYGFTDSPDAEVFAQGIAGKGPDTVPLGRHANYLLWGFSAPPADMTPAGQRLFVNAVCYIHKFDGQRPLVRNEVQSREWALRLAMSPRFLSQDYKEHDVHRRRAILEKHPEWIPAEYKGNADAFLNKTSADLQAAYARSIDGALPASLRQRFGLNADLYEAYYRENLEFLRPGERHGAFELDEEAKAVGPSNRRVEFLDRCVTMLENKDKSDRPLRLLKRYTNETFENAAEWRKWLDQNRSRLFFSDVGGYKFLVGPERPTAEAAAGEAVKR